MIAKIKEWVWWRYWSVQLAAVAAAITATLTANPEIVIGMIAMLPTGPAKLLIAAGAGILVFAVPTATRLLKQEQSNDDAA